MSTIVTADNGIQLDLDNLPQTFNNDGTNITSCVVTLNGVTYTQTISYSGSLVSGVSGWIAS